MTTPQRPLKKSALPPPPKKKKAWKLWLAIALPVLAVAGMLTWWLTRPHAPDPSKLKKEDAVKYMASKEFTKLPLQEREDYYKKMRTIGGDNPREMYAGLSDQERSSLRRNTEVLRRKEMRENMKKFFTMSKEEQNRYLDDMIKNMRNRGGGPGGPGGPGGNRPQGGQGAQGAQGGQNRGGNRDARTAQMLEGTDSNTRAQMAEFRKLMRERMQQARQSGSTTTTTASNSSRR